MGDFRSQRLNVATAGRHLDLSTAGRGKNGQSEGDTGLQEAKALTSGLCSASSHHPSCLFPEPRCRAPGMGTPGAGPAGSRGSPSGEGEIDWRACTRLGTRQWAPAELVSCRACLPRSSVNRAVLPSPRPPSPPEPGSVLFLLALCTCSRTPTEASFLSKQRSEQTLLPPPPPFPNTDRPLKDQPKLERPSDSVVIRV